MNMQSAQPLLTELQDFRRRYPLVDHFYALISDNNGVLRGKRLTLAELEEFFQHGRGVASSILWLDVTGKDIAHYDLVWQDGDSDRWCQAVPGTLTPAPWLGERYGQVLFTMSEPDGTPTPQDPRQVLAGVLQHFQKMGLRPVVAAELEFYLVERERTADGHIQPPKNPRTGERPTLIRGYEANELDDFATFLTEVHDTAVSMGIPAETVISEYGPSQFEIVLHHQDDALRAMDQAVLFKRVVKGVALKHGYIATFMAKPYAQESGSGLHVHMSVIDQAGHNVFADPSPAGSPQLHHAIGGLQKHLADSMLLFGPHANSYRRLRPGCYAPINTAWGINNRTVSLRVPASGPAARRLEHRVAGADANPYLVLAGILAAAHDGLVKQLDPGAPAVGDAGKLAAGGQGSKALPRNWQQAIDAFASSDFIRQYFPAGFIDTYVATKQAELAEFYGEVSPLDYDWYLRTV